MEFKENYIPEEPGFWDKVQTIYNHQNTAYHPEFWFNIEMQFLPILHIVKHEGAAKNPAFYKKYNLVVTVVNYSDL